MLAQPWSCLDGRHLRCISLGGMQALDLGMEDKNTISDAAKAARLLTDIAAVSQEIDLSGLALVEADTEYLEAVSQKVVPLPLLSMIHYQTKRKSVRPMKLNRQPLIYLLLCYT